MEAIISPTQDSILYQLAADLMAAAATDADRARIDRALDLVDHTERVANVAGLWLVYSQSDDSKAYTVDATTCSCPDFQKRGGWCKHRTAVKLAQMVERAEVDAEQAEGCIDCEDGGREDTEGLRRRCSNCPLTVTWTDEERMAGIRRDDPRLAPDAEQTDPTNDDAYYCVLCEEPIPAAEVVETRWGFMHERCAMTEPQPDDPDATRIELTGRGYLALVPPTALPMAEGGITVLPYTAAQRKIASELYDDLPQGAA